MALPLVVDGVTFNYPEPGDRGLAQDATDWANAVTTAVANLQTTYAADQKRNRVRAHISTPQTGISSATVVIFDSEDWDTASGYNPASGVFTVPSGYAGDYVITTSMLLTQVSSTAVQSISIQVNSADVAVSEYSSTAAGTGNAALATSCCYTLAVGDTVRVRVACTAGTITTVANANSQFSLLKVSHG